MSHTRPASEMTADFLFLAIESNFSECIRSVLKETKINVNECKSSDGATLLLKAANHHNRYELVKTLLELKAEPNLATDDDGTALHAAVECSNTLSLLLQAKADVNAKSKQGDTAQLLLHTMVIMMH